VFATERIACVARCQGGAGTYTMQIVRSAGPSTCR